MKLVPTTCLALGICSIVATGYALSSTGLHSSSIPSLWGIVLQSSHPLKHYFVSSLALGSLVVIISTVLYLGLPTPMILSPVYLGREEYEARKMKSRPPVSEVTQYLVDPILKEKAKDLNLPRPIFPE
eukprot:Protomagalhaensia_sp_Gyna_25__4669@NODE_43_length_6376_cov_123_651570_g32_i0_p6_GENE_NODE_43_length_6376_cov_123_651570_g32_i0NODE_43_length_6376_cov_123_651570_g32_i0_p6_ORF_typecomplete_len128_score0_97_NODE_43_length_6376_cov_123_651570_g32_i061444